MFLAFHPLRNYMVAHKIEPRLTSSLQEGITTLEKLQRVHINYLTI